jgi:hypothetical protein
VLNSFNNQCTSRHNKMTVLSIMLDSLVSNDQDDAEKGLANANDVNKLGRIDFCFYLTVEADPVSQTSECI